MCYTMVHRCVVVNVVCADVQYSVLLMIVFLLEAGSGVLTYLYEINVSSTDLHLSCILTALGPHNGQLFSITDSRCAM